MNDARRYVLYGHAKFCCIPICCTQEREIARKSRAAAGNRATDGGRDNFAKANIDLRKLALEALNPIAKKLNCIYTTSRERPEKETSISNLVEMLIREASDNGNLVSSSIVGAGVMLTSGHRLGCTQDGDLGTRLLW